MGELVVLRAIGLAGVADLAVVARATGLDTDDARARVAAAEGAELVAGTARGYRLTGAGRELVVGGLQTERAGLDPATTADLYDRFVRIDRKFKKLVTDYQLSNEANRFSWAVAGMSEVHPKARDLAGRAAELVPRLTPYGARFDDAMARLERGEEKYLVSMTVDSYHTVWFQFHEELIEMAGRTRAEEAAEGRG